MRLSRAFALSAFLATYCGATQALEQSFDADAGYRNDSLQWNIASDITGRAIPNIVSELKWTNLRIEQFKLAARFSEPTGEQLRLAAAFGNIISGKNQDSDYSGNDRTLEWSRSENKSNGDNVIDLSVAGGYRIELQGASGLRVTPLLGYSYHKQNLRITDGNQVVSDPANAPPGISPPPVGPFPDLNSTYKSQWKGPWLGIETAMPFSSSILAALQLEYHWADYYAVADWNLRNDPVTGFQHPKSFEHTASGQGVVASLSLLLGPQETGWSGRFSIDHQQWKTDPGTDETFFADGTSSRIRLNEVKWKSRAISVGATFRF